MKKNILSMAVLLMASAAVFTACSSDDNITGEQPANPTGKYTMTINASKGGDATTRALSLEGKTLNATWATTEHVYVKKGDTWATGSLQPEADGATATLKGTLSDIEINANDVLTLQFPKSGDISYAGQVGTLADIAANFDYATATVTVGSVSATGNIIPTAETTTFENQQAIVKFTLIDKADGSTPLSATQLVVNDGTTDYTITPESATSEIYAAIPGFTSKTVTLTATVGEDTYTYEKTGVSFTNGQYYEITVKMTKAAGPTLSLTNPAVGQVIGSDGKNYSDGDVRTVAAVAMIAYVSGDTGLAIALEDESGGMDWNAYMTVAAEHTPAFTGGTWRLPSQADWNNMLNAYNGLSNLNQAIENADGNTMEGGYWSSREDYEEAYYMDFTGPAPSLQMTSKYNPNLKARAVLAFTVESSAGPTAYTLAESTVGMVVGTDGLAYAAADKGNLPTGVTAVAMVAYKSETTGYSLAIALADEGSMNWATAISTCEGKAAIGDYSWKLPSQEEWVKMFSANGDSQFSCSGLNSAITTAGGTALQENEVYWSSSEFNSDNAFDVDLYGGGADWRPDPKNMDRPVRACLAF